MWYNGKKTAPKGNAAVRESKGLKTVYDDWEMEKGFDFFLEEFYYTEDVAMQDAHFHNYLEITAVTDGKIVYRFGDREVAAADGETVIVNHAEPHAARGTKDAAHIIVIGFRPELVWKGSDEVDYRYIENFFSGEEVFSNHIPRGTDHGARVFRLVCEIAAEYRRREDGYKLMIKAKLLELLTLLYRYQPRVLTPRRGKESEKFKRVLDYLYENSARPVTLEECAKIAGYSPAYFSVAFRRFSGKRFCDCLSGIRIENCCRLLCRTDLKIRDAAAKCGLGNSANFLTLFRRFKGTTPSRYRKEHQR